MKQKREEIKEIEKRFMDEFRDAMYPQLDTGVSWGRVWEHIQKERDDAREEERQKIKELAELRKRDNLPTDVTLEELDYLLQQQEIKNH